MAVNLKKLLLGFGQSVRIVGCITFVLEALLSPLGQASVLVRTPLTQEARLQVHLQKQRNGNQSFVEYWRSKNPSDEKVSELQRLFEEAQRTMLKDGPNPAKPKYVEVVGLATAADWKNTDREIIFQSLLRLASFENDSAKRKSFFAQALSLDSELKVDKEVFSPAFEKEYLAFRDSIQKGFVQWRPGLPPEVQIFINGRKADSMKVNLPPGTKRVTFVSNSYLPHTVLMDPESLKKTKIQLEPIVTGSCGSAKWNYQDIAATNMIAIFDNCIEDYDGKKVGFFESETRTAPPPASIHFPAEPPSKPIYKKPLFWVITGAIVVGAVLVWQKNNQDSKTTATHSEGL